MAIKKDCFAYKETNNKPTCHALTELDCKNCRFYKKREHIKNNPFYAYSYTDIGHFKYDINKHKIKEQDILN